ncbi:MAG: phosphotransferase [Rubrivivax sp.]|nr:phosphotransferase [Rubrivivax sp.]MDH5338924.1 phosphotransferase [Rubrivivax sp.]
MDQFTGTRPVHEQHAFDVAALQTYLSAHVEGFAGPLQVSQFKGGQSNPTFKVQTPVATYVLRSKPGPASRLLPSAHAIEREYRVMSALASQGVPVARMHLLCEDESVIGRAFYLMQFVDGRVLWDQSLPGMTPGERAALYDEMNRVIATLHRVDVAGAGLADYGRPGSYIDRQIGRWSKQYLASRTGPLDPMDRLLEWLPAHVPASARDETQVSVVHGDYRLDNLIFHPDQPRVLAVLDWELSTLGHPLADFSYHCMGWHIPPGTFRGIGGLDLATLGIPAERDYVRRYCERTSRFDVDSLMADWNFYLAYNLFRLAAITQGIAKRVLDGTAASEQARATGAATPALAELAWRFAERA